MKQLPKRLRPLGAVYVDVFKIQIPLWTSEKTRVKALRHLGIEADTPAFEILGTASRTADAVGNWLYSLTIMPEAGPDTWAHEAVHMADFIMDTLEMPTDLENTEVRAYITGHIVNQIHEIMDQAYQPVAQTPSPTKH